MRCAACSTTLFGVRKTALIAVLASSTLFAQQPMPIALGSAVSRLTPDVVSAIATAIGERPWLIDDFRGPIELQSGERTWVAQGYLAPNRETSELRRGRIVNVESRTRTGSPGQWVVGGTREYAQLVAAGRRYDDVQGTMDRHRPFYVVAGSDADIVAVSRFLESKPPLVTTTPPGDGNPRFRTTAQFGPLVIFGAGRIEGRPPLSPSAVVVHTRRSEGCSDIMSVELVEGQWQASWLGVGCS